MTCPVSLFHEVATLLFVHLLTCPGLEAGGIHGIHTRCLLPRAKSKGSSWGREEGVLMWEGKEGMNMNVDARASALIFRKHIIVSEQILLSKFCKLCAKRAVHFATVLTCVTAS